MVPSDGVPDDQSDDHTFVCRQELERPIRLVVAPRGPDTELLVAAPVEVNGRSRPRVFYDCTLGLRRANVCVFQASVPSCLIFLSWWEHEHDKLRCGTNCVRDGDWTPRHGHVCGF
jgi:hypothetical protein